MTNQESIAADLETLKKSIKSNENFNFWMLIWILTVLFVLTFGLHSKLTSVMENQQETQELLANYIMTPEQRDQHENDQNELFEKLSVQDKCIRIAKRPNAGVMAMTAKEAEKKRAENAAFLSRYCQ